MIIKKVCNVKSLKGKDTLSPMFKEADQDKDGLLNYKEWKAFSNLLAAKMKENYGASYTLNDDQLKKRF
jgi:hypothetical protein